MESGKHGLAPNFLALFRSPTLIATILLILCYSFSFTFGSFLPSAIRAITGSIIALILPGYYLNRLFSGGRLSKSAEIAVSIGLSISILQFLTLIMGSYQGGVSSLPIGFATASLALALAFIATYRESSSRPEDIKRSATLSNRRILFIVAVISLFLFSFYLRARTLTSMPYSGSIGHIYDAPYHYAYADYMSKEESISLTAPYYWSESRIPRPSTEYYPYPFFSLLLVALQKVTGLEMLTCFKIFPTVISSLIPFSWLCLLEEMKSSKATELTSMLLLSTSSFLLGLLYIAALPGNIALFMIPLILIQLVANPSRASIVSTALMVVSVTLTHALTLIALVPLPLLVFIALREDRRTLAKRVAWASIISILLLSPFFRILREGGELFWTFPPGSRTLVQDPLLLLGNAIGVEIFLPVERYIPLLQGQLFRYGLYILFAFTISIGLAGLFKISRSREKIGLLCAYTSNLPLLLILPISAFASWRIVQLQLPFIISLSVGEGLPYIWNKSRRLSTNTAASIARKLIPIGLVALIVFLCASSLFVESYPTGGLSADGEKPGFTKYASIYPDQERLLAASLYIRDNQPPDQIVYFHDNVQDGLGWAYPSWLSALSRHTVATSRPSAEIYILALRDASSISVFLVRNGTAELLYTAS